MARESAKEDPETPSTKFGNVCAALGRGGFEATGDREVAVGKRAERERWWREVNGLSTCVRVRPVITRDEKAERERGQIKECRGRLRQWGFPLSFEALPCSPTSPVYTPPTVAQNKALTTFGPRSPTTPTLCHYPLSTDKHTSPAHQSDDPSGQSAQQNVRPSYRVRASARWGEKVRLSEWGV